MHSLEELEEELENLLGPVKLKKDSSGRLVIHTKMIETDDGFVNEDELDSNSSDDDYSIDNESFEDDESEDDEE